MIILGGDGHSEYAIDFVVGRSSANKLSNAFIRLSSGCIFLGN
jgi:hypothetical protein